MQRVSQLAVRRLLSSAPAAAAARRSAPVAAESVSGGGSILLPRSCGAGFSGDNLLQQSISLLRVKDPLFKRMGASRLARFAVDDQRRMKVVEMGGAQELLNVLEGAKDDKTRKEVLKTLVELSKSEEAAGFLDKAGAYAIVSSIPNSPEYAEIETYKTRLLTAFDKLKS
ncbi:hypothetical protein HU200_044302 [Digitaria exilis]|uniref:Uncharacterized protein n=1 Tax=Digitaria exilis TaxID=1010633 RepID=A0A835B7Q1_9POAL|nr:hypothetical protein HU200_044302 [Digitaria exilis]